MLSRIMVRFFGNIWKLKELCNEKSGIQARLYKFIYNYYLFDHGSSIPFNTNIKGVPTFPHGIKQIIITKDATIGENCVIFQQVTIAADFLPHSESFGSPTIGDNCYIYPGAKIIGNVLIGNNVIIGANAVVNQDIPDNSHVKVPDSVYFTVKNMPENKYYSLIENKWMHLDGYTVKKIKDDSILKKLNNE